MTSGPRKLTDADYGAWLRWRREMYRQTPAQVAKALDCSLTLLDDLETGRQPIVGQWWDRITDWLGVGSKRATLADAKRYIHSQRHRQARLDVLESGRGRRYP